jgi:hypothetical protein
VSIAHLAGVLPKKQTRMPLVFRSWDCAKIAAQKLMQSQSLPGESIFYFGGRSDDDHG